MEQDEEKRKKRTFRSSISVMMSFVLAFVTMVSVIAYSFDKISFALPAETTSEFPDTIKTGTESSDDMVVKGKTATTQIRLHTATVNGKTEYVYCIEADLGIGANTDYKKDKKIEDNGLLFLLTYLTGSNYSIVDSSGNDLTSENGKKAAGWIKQTAIWVYQHEVGAVHNTGDGFFDDAAIEKVRHETILYLLSSGVDQTSILNTGTTPIYDSCKVNGKTINELIADAKKIHNGTLSWNSDFTLNVQKKSDTISLSSDKKYYQSDVITVSGNAGFLGFEVSVESDVTGVQIVDLSGNEITDLDNLSAGTQFVVRVPKDKVSDSKKTIKIQITGAFKGNVAYRYFYEDMQSVAYTGDYVKHEVKGTDIEIVPIPDTASSAAQSIYLVGLIILLTGVGIIYANIKPRKSTI